MVNESQVLGGQAIAMTPIVLTINAMADNGKNSPTPMLTGRERRSNPIIERLLRCVRNDTNVKMSTALTKSQKAQIPTKVKALKKFKTSVLRTINAPQRMAADKKQLRKPGKI